jgi:hypothetical protein
MFSDGNIRAKAYIQIEIIICIFFWVEWPIIPLFPQKKT